MQPETRSATCADTDRYLEAYVDGEFHAAGDDTGDELERHLAGCPACARRARLQAAFKAGLKAAYRRPPLPEGLRARLEAQLARQPPPGRSSASGPWARPLSVLRTAMPALAAAAVLLTLIGTSHRFSPVAAEAISNHRRGLPIEVAGSPAQVTDWFTQKVDFPVRPPQMMGATLVGGRLAHIRDRQAAYLLYNVSGNRVSVFLFDPADLPIDARRRRSAGGHEVFLDDQRGYHVALVRNGGLGYAVASDLDEDRIFQLVSSSISR